MDYFTRDPLEGKSCHTTTFGKYYIPGTHNKTAVATNIIGAMRDLLLLLLMSIPKACQNVPEHIQSFDNSTVV
jgi:hypothetical protein